MTLPNYHFELPKRLTDFFIACEQSESSVYSLLGIRLREDTPENLHETIPYEFLSIGWGAGGDYYGVLHLDESLPHEIIGYCSYTDESAVWAHGTDMQSSLDQLATDSYEFLVDGKEDEEAMILADICKAQGINCINGSTDVEDLKPFVRPGWTHIVSFEGIGVFAPDSYFEPEHKYVHVWDHDYQDILKKAEQLLDKYPASAAIYLIDLRYWCNWIDIPFPDGPAWFQCNLMLYQAYKKMGKEFLAQRVLHVMPEIATQLNGGL